MPRERDFTASTLRINRPEPLKAFGEQEILPKPAGPKRAVSMTRLDQLAQPRQRYLEATIKQRTGNGNAINDCMVKSMIELPAKTPPPHSAVNIRITKGMSTSMTQLNRSFARPKPRPSAVPQSATFGGAYTPDQLVSHLHKKLSKSMVQLNVKSPRETRSSRLRVVLPTPLKQSGSSLALDYKAPSKYRKCTLLNSCVFWVMRWRFNLI